MRAAALAAVLALGASCQALFTSQGNAYPCDGGRSGECAAGDICGIDGFCRAFVYEGPRFEGLPTFPDFSADAGAGATLHPRVLTSAPAAVVRDLRTRALVVAQRDGRVFRLSASGLEALGVLPAGAQAATLLSVFGPDNGPTVAAVRTANGELRVFGLDGMPPNGNEAVGTIDRFHVIDAPLRGLLALATTGSGYARAQVALGLRPLQLANHPTPFPVLEIGFSARPAIYDGPVLVSATGLFGELSDGGVASLSAGEAASFRDGARLRQDGAGNVFAIASPQMRLNQTLDVLSVWQIVRGSDGPRAQRAWSDCAPCQERGLLAFAPAVSAAGLTVDVVCGEAVGAPTAFRVTGSVASVETQACIASPLTAPFQLAKLARLNQPGGGLEVLQDEVGVQGFTLAGSSGELWVGPTLEATMPLFLDRVPTDVATAIGPAGAGEIALTDAYTARLDLTPEGNGFVRVDTSAFDRGGTVKALALVHQAGSWVLTSQGQLVELPSEQGQAPSFGPRLVDDRGAPVARALWGEAVVHSDGGIVSMLLAADDGLYFIPASSLAYRAPDEERTGPVLRPEPGAPIRHLALERTPLGTDGVSRVRAFAVTSRTVFAIELGGTPTRWKATPLVLAGGEPVETWFDNPRGGLGRVGFRDGRIFTLPGSFQLTEALPTDGGEPPQVLDFENLAGWPLALSSAGLFVARWDATDEGRLANRGPDGVVRPMTWREVTLPDGGAPWFDRRPGSRGQVREGRLYVREEPQASVMVGDALRYRRTYRAFVFTGEEVLELGRHVRSNVTAAR